MISHLKLWIVTLGCQIKLLHNFLVLCSHNYLRVIKHNYSKPLLKPIDSKYIYLKNGFLENAFRNSANSRTLVGRASCMIESLEIWTATHQERQSLPLSSSEEAVDMERCLKTNLGDMSIPYYHRWPKYWHLTEYSPAASIMSRQIVLPIRIKREYFPKV